MKGKDYLKNSLLSSLSTVHVVRSNGKDYLKNSLLSSASDLALAMSSGKDYLKNSLLSSVKCSQNHQKGLPQKFTTLKREMFTKSSNFG